MRIAGPWAGSLLIPTIRPPRFSPGSSRWRPRSRDESDDETRLRYLDGTHAVVKFFGSRLKWSRWAAVDLVDGENSETLVRTVAEHFVRFGGVPLCAVFDRPKTVALKCQACPALPAHRARHPRRPAAAHSLHRVDE